MDKLYGIKISKPEFMKTGGLVRSSCLWVNEHEDDYVKKSEAKVYRSFSDAKSAITEAGEFVAEL